MNTASEKPLFILIDDDSINNSISRLTITNAISAVEVIMFTDPIVGLVFLKDHFKLHTATSTVLLLNLNMPFMTGWEFLERFSELETVIRERIRIYILSSSIDIADRKRSENIDCVKGYLTKPLSTDLVTSL
jgi:response regulator RpfG family c-di-GMP phosphodiesterase